MKKGIILRLLTELRPYRLHVILSLCLAVVTVVLTLLIPVWIGDAVDCIVSKGEVDWQQLGFRLICIGVAAIVSALTTYVMNCLNNRISFGVVRRLRDRAFLAIHTSDVGTLVGSSANGDIVSRIINDADAVGDGMLMGSTNLFTGVLTIIGTLVFMFRVHALIALAVVCVTPVSLLVARFIATHSYRYFRAQSADRGEETEFIGEAFDSLHTVQAFGWEEAMEKAFDEKEEKLRRDSLGATFISSITNPATRFVNSLVYAAVGVFGALFAIRGGITVGGLTCILSYANQYTKPFNEISGVITELQNSFACAGRIFELIDGKKEEIHGSDTVLTESDGSVSMENVSFSYNTEQSLIEDLNLAVSPGERIAIVGPTGAGKSTLINLLMRFYDVDRGRILVSGHDIRRVTRDSLRECFGMVLQETWLETGTIRENIAMGDSLATKEDVVRAAKAAYADRFIERLPHGYDTRVGEDGVSLSLGQKQLICIARVMLKLPPMLILDEATSSIDLRTEILIRRAFDSMMRGRTCFIVAHRLQTIRGADRILVMRDGKIIEQGDHDSLMQADGYYKQLYQLSLNND